VCPFLHPPSDSGVLCLLVNLVAYGRHPTGKYASAQALFLVVGQSRFIDLPRSRLRWPRHGGSPVPRGAGRLTLPHLGETRRRWDGCGYKAEDTRLDRFVALKFLPEEPAQDRDIGEENGRAFLAMSISTAGKSADHCD